MSADHPKQGLKSRFEEVAGPIDDSMWADIEGAAGVSFEKEPGRWEEAIRTATASAGTLGDPYSIVQPVFEGLLDEASRAGVEPLATLPTWTPGQRAVLATRVISGEIDNGGAFAVFYNSVDLLLPDAVDGFRLLGLPTHADAISELVASGFNGDSPEGSSDAFESTWFGLPDAEPNRAGYITAHPSEFAT